MARDGACCSKGAYPGPGNAVGTIPPTTREAWQRVKRIAGDARERPDEAREAFLAEACAGDAVLRASVDGLLVSVAAAESAFETSVATPTGVPSTLERAFRQQQLESGTVLGPYRILREIGHGGMGRVYLAERADGAYDLQVAIKLVDRLGSDAVLARFHDERQILASLDHANIAHLVDGGSTTDGVPYLAMEYVDGEPIEAYCDNRRLDLAARLTLFRHVCAAVHYAHQRLVIHRDIKNNNILVTRDGVPKLLDFGIAKVLSAHGDQGAATLLRALTPDSASPEQVQGMPVTIATDVYSLGVLLYRLLSGQSPYRTRQTSEMELLRAICERIPAPPLEARREAGAPAWSVSAFARDLDAITLMALRKEPERRYGSVAEFADDIERFQRGLPVRAAPDSRTYRARKFVARHRGGVAAATLGVCAVLAGAGIAVYQSQVAQRERAVAERRFADVRRMANTFVFDVHDAIADLPGSLNARKMVVARAAEYLDGLAVEAEGDAALQRELASANMRLAIVLGGGGVSNLGDQNGAGLRFAKARALFEQLTSRPDATSADTEGFAQLKVQTSRFAGLRGDFAAAERDAQDAVTLLEPTGADNLATAYHTLGFMQARQGRNAAAVASYREAVARARRALERQPDDPAAIARLSRIASDYGDQIATGRPAEALEVLGESRALLDRLLVLEPHNVRHRSSLLQLLTVIGATHAAHKHYPQAIDALSEADTSFQALRAESPDDYGFAIGQMMVHFQLGEALAASGDGTAAERVLRRAIDEGSALMKQVPDSGSMRGYLDAARLDLAALLLERPGQRRAGCAALVAGLRGWRELQAIGQFPGELTPRLAGFVALETRCVGIN